MLVTKTRIRSTVDQPAMLKGSNRTIAASTPILYPAKDRKEIEVWI